MRLISHTHTVEVGEPGRTRAVPPGEPFDGDGALVRAGIAERYTEPEPEPEPDPNPDSGGDEANPDSGGEANPDGGGEANPDLLNINTATPEQLAEVIPRVGKQTAADIVAWREKQPFTSVDQLADVGGVGAASVEKVRHLLTV